MNKNIIISLKYLVASTLLFGLAYTFAITAAGYVLFNHKVNGSLIEKEGVLVGSKLIGQKFSDPKFFWGRPSSCDYGTDPSGASNYGSISTNLKKEVDDRIQNLKQFDPKIKADDIPPELLLASGSGLDPHISQGAALFQVDRVAKARNLTGSKREKVVSLIQGQLIVNVLELNMDLEKVSNGK
jgi:potassium-transporting ATPase KdpC subunit